MCVCYITMIFHLWLVYLWFSRHQLSGHLLQVDSSLFFTSAFLSVVTGIWCGYTGDIIWIYMRVCRYIYMCIYIYMGLQSISEATCKWKRGKHLARFTRFGWEFDHNLRCNHCTVGTVHHNFTWWCGDHLGLATSQVENAVEKSILNLRHPPRNKANFVAHSVAMAMENPKKLVISPSQVGLPDISDPLFRCLNSGLVWDLFILGIIKTLATLAGWCPNNYGLWMFMVYSSIDNGVYKPTNITRGAPH